MEMRKLRLRQAKHKVSQEPGLGPEPTFPTTMGPDEYGECWQMSLRDGREWHRKGRKYGRS